MEPNERPNKVKHTVQKNVRVFGDLREKLNQKRAEKEQKQCGPPPDPIYNYLRDPERDGERTLESKQVRPQREYRPFKNNYNQKKPFNQHYENKQRKDAPIKPTYNIKVQLAIDSGERTCTIDTNNPLPSVAVKNEKQLTNVQKEKEISSRNFNKAPKPNYFGRNKHNYNNQNVGYIKTTNFYPKRDNNTSFNRPKGYNKQYNKQGGTSSRKDKREDGNKASEEGCECKDKIQHSDEEKNKDEVKSDGNDKEIIYDKGEDSSDKEKESSDQEKVDSREEKECKDKEKGCSDKQKKDSDKEKESNDKKEECSDKQKEDSDKEKESSDKESSDKEKESNIKAEGKPDKERENNAEAEKSNEIEGTKGNNSS